ncbi:hypothetical protein LCGC14_2567870 [marine sediment metagenome]|uniref:Uncharacterized protein n=1 Tax=marine sediment metagenome TaxID=412755 RepID=A0A0F9CU84_9ZZZZ
MYPNLTEEEYDTLMIKARYETMGWDTESPPRWEFELDETGTKLVPKNKIGVEVP